MRIAVDVMGGDNAPDAILDGCALALDLLKPEDRLVLIGDQAIIEEALSEAGRAGDPRIEIESTDEVIGMDEMPVEALRGKPNSSISRMAWLGSQRAGDRLCDIIVSAGNTGACVAASQMSMRRLAGVHRPGIAVTIPTFHGPICVCDVGANIVPKPTHLHQYGIMAGIYYRKIINDIPDPRVALLSIGGEEGKGTSLVKDTHRLMKQDTNLNYVGYVEGREIFDGKADIIVTEGFTGNVVLKLAEGLSSGLFKTIAHEIFEEDPELAMKFEPVVKKIYKKHDYHEYGGAPLLGARGTCIICHGSSEPRTIRNAIANAIDYVNLGINDLIVASLAEAESLQADEDAA